MALFPGGPRQADARRDASAAPDRTVQPRPSTSLTNRLSSDPLAWASRLALKGKGLDAGHARHRRPDANDGRLFLTPSTSPLASRHDERVRSHRRRGQRPRRRGLAGRPPFKMRGLGSVTAKGKTESVEVFEVDDTDSNEVAERSDEIEQVRSGTPRSPPFQIGTSCSPAGPSALASPSWNRAIPSPSYFRDRSTLDVAGQCRGKAWDGSEHLEQTEPLRLRAGQAFRCADFVRRYPRYGLRLRADFAVTVAAYWTRRTLRAGS